MNTLFKKENHRLTGVFSNLNKLKFFKHIFARIWALWGLITFTLTFMAILPFAYISAFIKNPITSQHWFTQVSRVWMHIWLTLIGCPVRINGRHHFQKGRNYIVVFNHNALLDVPLSAPFVPGVCKTIAKDSFAKVPLFGWFYSKGAVLVNRKNDKSRVQSFDKMKDILKSGMNMCIYPEGTRNRTNMPLKPFHDGAFRLSAETGIPIIPCIIKGTKKAMPINQKFYLFPTQLSMEFLNPVYPIGKTAQILKEEIHDVMVKKHL